ncbi:metal-dependent hydrolase [Amycolatopsis sp. NPDC051903]|uniref:metal-dependent hydrolase n=1 Tax=Amycolatopsis sp. NPDC051903 TaxID=3363936 RepID=UPI0037B6978D
MGRTHALTGALAGLLVGRLIGLSPAVGSEPGFTGTLAACAALGPFAAVTAGYALVPDLDHRSSSATRLLGPLTRVLSRGLRAASRWLYARTKGPLDEPGGEHRHLTHTLVFAVALGGICAGTTAAWGPWAVLGWLVFGLALAVDRLGPVALVAYGAGAAVWLPATARGGDLPSGQALLAALDASSGWLGLAVALGCAVHCLGDALTESGCPLLWPFLPIRGEIWYELRPPAWLRFHTGKRFERLVVFPLVALGCLAAIPGLAPQVIELFTPPTHLAAGGGLR